MTANAAPTGEDYFANHRRARQFPWTLYHQPIERDLAAFLRRVAVEQPGGEVLIVGCGLLHEIDEAPEGMRFHVVDIDARAVDVVLERRDPRITGGTVVPPEQPLQLDHQFAAIYGKEVIEHVLFWPHWLIGLRRTLVPGGLLWLSTPNYGEPWLAAVESTVLEVIAWRSGFSRRDMHPTRFSRSALERGLVAARFEDVSVRSISARLALVATARAPMP